VNTTLDCVAIPIGVIAGLTGGIIAAIILAALCALACASGGAYAVTHAVNEQRDTEVVENPLYQGSGFEAFNPLHHHHNL